MTEDFEARWEALCESNHPLFTNRKLKLGTFATNVEGGCVKTTIPGQAEATWQSTVGLAKTADAMGFEALVPLGRWRGFGGVTDHCGPNFESYSWAAGVGGATQQAAVFATSHVPTVHPILAAKQGATIDHITGGRFALNVVCGWDSQMNMFGPSLLPHEDRYEQAAEWLEIIKRLWTEEQLFDFKGKYYTINEGYLQPKPVCRPYPPVMNAGTSTTGKRFAARYCDVAFVTPSVPDVKAEITAYRKIAREEFGRDHLQIWTYAYVVQGETEKDAQDFLHYYVHEHGDWECAKNMIDAHGASGLDEQSYRRAQAKLIAGGGCPLIGTKEQIVDGLQQLADWGLDGVLLSWAQYQDGMEQFRAETLPLVQQAGLR
jgi:alkanesulfonate monooxygenase SsuD/methylene tetrahydromethanopterin reductase-like flavin-dependent oxidoreductase (luciferase family)